MSKSNNLTDFLTNTADAIRYVKGSTALINPQNFENEIKSMLYLPAKGTALNSFPWKTIKYISDNGFAGDYFSIGDTKNFNLNGQTIRARYVDTVYNGQSGMLFFCDGLTTQYGSYNQSGGVANTSGGYGNSMIASTLENTLFNNFPDDLHDIIKTCSVKYNLGGSSKNTSLGTTNYHVFLPTGKELTGSPNYYNGVSNWLETWNLNDGDYIQYFEQNPTAPWMGYNYLLRQAPYAPYVGIVTQSVNGTRKELNRLWYSTAARICFLFMI